MKYYPVFLVLRDRPCVVVGGGEVAERKALSLLEAGADVTVVSPTLTPKLAGLAHTAKINHIPRAFEEHDLTGMFLAVAATDSPEVNTAVGRLCRKKHILVNVVAPPEESSFLVPSVVERGDLAIAISTGGASPGLSKRIRQELEDKYGREYEGFLARMAVLRKRLMDEVPDEKDRRDIMSAVLDSDALYLLKNGEPHEAEHRIEEIVRQWKKPPRDS
jgi:precorrin-2 dehydrogenase/sirohydrochlorin ferrochelatase